ncbi:SLBB domain-containing protein, partial [Streptomyces sp. G35A]
MALRSRSRTATATSGPGRGPGSDGRARHRRPAPPRGRARPAYRQRDRDAPGEELRRRAEVLFGEGGAGAMSVRGARRVPSWARSGPDEAAYAREETPARDDASGVMRPPDRWGERLGLALRERLPLWVRTRCGMERRSVVALSVVLVVAVGFAVQHFWAGRAQPVRAPEVVRAVAPPGERGRDGGGREAGGPAEPAGAVAAAGTAGPEIVVDVSGTVRDPGVHRLPAGSRVEDALRAAGGVRPGTRTDGLNRARFLVDGEQV